MQEYSVGYNSDRGTTHEKNQDSLCLKSFSRNGGKIIVAGVFDGMGGLSDGERISGAAAKAVSAWSEKNAKLLFTGNYDAICKSLVLFLDELNEQIRGYCKREETEAGTTAVILILGEKGYISCNIGDSRAYHIKNREAEQISEDHSLAASLVNAGMLTKEQAKNYPKKNVLLQALGVLEKITPAFRSGWYEANDAFLLCSDGFYNGLSDLEIGELNAAWHSEESLSETLKKATEKVISRGETDNITGVLIKRIK